LINISVV